MVGLESVEEERRRIEKGERMVSFLECVNEGKEGCESGRVEDEVEGGDVKGYDERA